MHPLPHQKTRRLRGVRQQTRIHQSGNEQMDLLLLRVLRRPDGIPGQDGQSTHDHDDQPVLHLPGVGSHHARRCRYLILHVIDNVYHSTPRLQHHCDCTAVSTNGHLWTDELFHGYGFHGCL